MFDKTMSQSAVADLIGKIAASAKEVQGYIHAAAWNCLEHIRVHGDYTNALRLLNALPNGLRVKGLAFWFKTMSTGKFRPLQDSKTKVYGCEKLGADRSDADFLMERAEETTFAELTGEINPGTTYTLDKLIKKLKDVASETGLIEGTDKFKVEPAARAVAMTLYASYQKALALRLEDVTAGADTVPAKAA